MTTNTAETSAAVTTSAAVKATVKRLAKEVMAKAKLVPPKDALAKLDADKHAETMASLGLPVEPEVTPAAKAKPEPKPVVPASYLMFIGETFYTKDAYCEEAALMGISKRMPSYRLPVDLVVGESKVYLVAGGTRKTKLVEGEVAPVADIFGSFTPEAIEFIAGEDGESGVYADICAYAKAKTEAGWRIVRSVAKEAKRLCGHRKLGGTYLVTTKAEGEEGKSPITMLAKAAPFKGNHFRGMMRLTPEQVTAIEAGEGLDRLTTVKCEDCGEDMLVSPDSVARQAREDRRAAKGEERKWHLRCRPCASKAREEAKAANEAATAGEPVDAEVAESTVVGVDATAAS